jgi:hypothetical protein
MTRAAAYASKAVVARAIACAKAAGVRVGGVRLEPGGIVVVLDAEAVLERASAGGAFERWEAQQKP